MMPTSPEPQRLADAALLVGLMSVLAFQELRIDGYEAEKAGILLMCACVIAAVWLHNPRATWRDLRAIVRHPTGGSILLFALSAFVSAVFSLHPLVSFLGSTDRGQGILFGLCGLIFIAQTARRADAVAEWLLPCLSVLLPALCAFAFFQHQNMALDRPGSTAGNPNYLASWLMLALFAVGYAVLAAGKTRWRGLLWALLTALCLLTLLLTGSRGALLGSAAGGMTLLIFWLAHQQHRRALLLLWLAGGVGLTCFAILSSALIAGKSEETVPRALRLTDAFRVNAWMSAEYLLTTAHVPLYDWQGHADPNAALRLFIGYGQDVIPPLYTRLDVVYGYQAYLTSFHHLGLDTWVMQGAMGVVALCAVFGSVLYSGLRASGWSRVGRGWLIAIGSGIAASTLWLSVAIWYFRWEAHLPLGIGLGLLLGVWGGMTWRALKHDMLPAPKPRVMLLLAGAAAYWVDAQLGVTTIASAPLWWLLLGLFIAETSPSADMPSPAEPLPAPRLWFSVGSVAGLFWIYTLGVSLDSQYMRHIIGSDYQPIALVLTGMVAWLGAWLWSASRARLLRAGVGMVALWGGAAVLKMLLNQAGAAALDRALATVPILPAALLGAALLLSLKGVALVGGALVVAGAAFRARGGRALVIIGISVLLPVTVYYAVDHSGALLHTIGQTYAQVNTAPARVVSRAAYEAIPSLVRVRGSAALDWIAVIDDEPARLQVLRDFAQWQPYYRGTRQWQTLCAWWTNCPP
jgi:hypothetical protein